MLIACGLLQPVYANNPVIDIWYGNPQSFGHIGNPQYWVNVLGNVADPDGIQSLTYSLNGGASQNLSVGPDTRRLLEAGDFNVEIDYTDLVVGANTIAITAVDTLSNTTVHNVTLNYTAGMVWPFSFTADWGQAATISDVAQVVDGKWAIGINGISPTIMGYDRTFAIGDLFWSDYEITVPITIHAIDPNGFIWPSVSPGIGFTGRWTGHTTLVIGEQPHAFWQPAGGSVWYDAGAEKLSLSGSTGGGLLVEDLNRTLTNDVEYIWKLRLETLSNGDTFYGMKLWEQGQTEPVAWDYSGTDNVPGILNGSTIFIAHHVDATYGNVTIADLASDTDPPVIFNSQVLHGTTSAQIRWNTDEPATGSVDYGLTAAYEIDTISQPVLGTNHSVLLPGLVPGNTYHYRINATDARSNSASTSDATFEFTGVPGIVSDDFSSPTLDSQVWAFVNPLSDATLMMTGTQAEIWVPDTAIHDVWTGTNTLPRLRQGIPDEDFEAEIKFESDITQSFQSQGILVEQADTVVLRSEFHQVNGQNKIYVASIVPTAQTRLSQQIAFSNPMYMRMSRAGDQWTVRYSYDGQAWIDAVTFSQAMTVTSVSVYGGNSGVEHTSTIDYFFNTAAPISPEDGGLSVVTSSLAGGTVTQVYSETLVASSGTLPYDWSISGGALPPGLTLSSAGVISGTPTTDVGSPFNFQVQVEDATLATATADLSIAIAPPPPPMIDPITLPVGAVGALYPDQTLTGTGGIAPYTWTVVSGTLPPGLSLSTAGVISGTPTDDTGSPYGFTVQLEDSVSATTTANLSITILGVAPPPPIIDPIVLPTGTVGQLYPDQTLTVTGGLGPYDWSIASGALPPGLTLSSAGVISGTPTSEIGSPFAFTVQVTDAMAMSATDSLNIVVDPAPPPPLVIDPIVLPGGEVGVVYPTQTMTATGGVPTYSWTVSAGSLPPGLTLDTGGDISGTPTDATGSPFDFTIEVTDSAIPAVTDTIELSIAITPPPPLPLIIDVTPLTEKPVTEAPINRQFSGMAPVPGFATPTSRIPLIDDGRLINDITPSVETNLGGGLMVVENGKPAMDINPGFIVSFPHWSSQPSVSLDNATWTMFVDVDINAVQGDFPGVIAQRNNAAAGFWELIRYNNGPDMSFAWRASGESFQELVFPNAWPGTGRHQFVLTYDNGTFTLFVDGVQAGQGFNASPVPGGSATHDLLLGVAELDSFDQNRLDARFHNIWFNTHTAISGTDVAALQTNPWQIYSDANLPGGTVGQVYSGHTLTVSGGTAPYAWSLAGGSLPPGMTLSTTGVISGTPTSSVGSPFSFTVQVTDNDGTVATHPYSIEIQDAPLAIEITHLPETGTKGEFYWWGGLSASGGQPPYTYSIIGGWIPWPMTLNPDTGVIMGIPANVETAYFTVQVMDANSDTATLQSQITVNGPNGGCSSCHGATNF